jgi:hypothetical protein
MVSLGLRSVTATALSLWLGVLACVLGCAKASAASAPTVETQVSVPIAAQCLDRDNESAESCCRHGHNPGNGSGKNQRHSNSCCPTETALIQKQNAVPPSVVHLYVAALALADFHATNFVSANATSSILWHLGRDILLLVHVLRI